ncbi:DUF4105 domain-containing protein [Moraxella nasovis]|uniref:Lnb N-terminal periplasmic domain-containing protein n=1 Tax=Moraxella nasovis TaxID=2904121 RepID=UPI001F61CBAC|nr:DUF4105 domain-containing protein [Moraxella nasovis]UNU72917.1 DUF4105 domain-containing protein [Moraxella nasovis]
MLSVVFYVLLCIALLIACTAVWVNMPFGLISYAIIGLAVLIMAAISLKSFYFSRQAAWVGVIVVAAVLAWLISLRPSNDRIWSDDVARIVNYERNLHNPNLITIHHVRNFNWRSEEDYDIRWDTRQYNLDQLDTMDLVLSIWDNENIAHTLVTFGFTDGQYVAFSVEIRKEQGEQFSAIGGFFRKYELAIIAADEKDIIYTRSNIRKEKVYLYPISYDKAKMRELFLTYLRQGDKLNHQPRWYNTLISNCTTVIYQLVQRIDPAIKRIPMDYRILVSGRLPSYLIEEGIIRPSLPADEWKKLAYINPKVADYDEHNPISSDSFSSVIREGLPR